MKDTIQIILQILFFTSIAIYIGIFFGIITDLKNKNKDFSDTSEKGYINRRNFYNSIYIQSYLGFIIFIISDILSEISGFNYLSSLSIVAVYIIFILEIYMFFIYPGFDHMLCGLHTKDESNNDKIVFNDMNNEDDINYDKLFDIENNSIGRPFYKTSRLKNSDDFKNKVNNLFKDIKNNRNIDQSLTVNDLLDDIKKYPEADVDLRINFKLTNYEIDDILSSYITSITYYDDKNMKLNKNAIKYINKQNVLNDKKIIEDIDSLTNKKSSDSILIRNGIFGGSLFSVIGKLDFNYESINSIKDDDKNYLLYYNSIYLFFSQFLIIILANLNLFSNLWNIISNAITINSKTAEQVHKNNMNAINSKLTPNNKLKLQRRGINIDEFSKDKLKEGSTVNNVFKELMEKIK